MLEHVAQLLPVVTIWHTSDFNCPREPGLTLFQQQQRDQARALEHAVPRRLRVAWEHLSLIHI
eukprot:9954653-Alexandrium_andersonii.AAC.1